MDVLGVVITCITCQLVLEQLSGALAAGGATAAAVML